MNVVLVWLHHHLQADLPKKCLQLNSYQICYKEGFDVDIDYIEWLQLHHPEALPEDPYEVNNDLTLDDHFSSVTPAFSTEVSRLHYAITSSIPHTKHFCRKCSK